MTLSEYLRFEIIKITDPRSSLNGFVRNTELVLYDIDAGQH